MHEDQDREATAVVRMDRDEHGSLLLPIPAASSAAPGDWFRLTVRSDGSILATRLRLEEVGEAAADAFEAFEPAPEDLGASAPEVEQRMQAFRAARRPRIRRALQTVEMANDREQSPLSSCRYPGIRSDTEEPGDVYRCGHRPWPPVPLGPARGAEGQGPYPSMSRSVEPVLDAVEFVVGEADEWVGADRE